VAPRRAAAGGPLVDAARRPARRVEVAHRPHGGWVMNGAASSGAEEHAGRAHATCGRRSWPCLAWAVASSSARPGLGVEGDWARLYVTVRGTRRQLGQEGLVVTEPLVVRDQLEDPWPARLPRHRWPGARRLCRGPGTRPCFERCRMSRRREAERPCTEGLFDQLGHLGDLVVGGVLVGTLAEHVGAQGAWDWVATSIVRGWRPRRRVLREGLPLPLDPSWSACPGCPRHLPSTR